MKRHLNLLFIIVIASNQLFCQTNTIIVRKPKTESISKDFIQDILEYETMKKGELSIVSGIDPSFVESHLKSLTKNKTFISMKDSKEFIKLSEKERKLLIDSLRQQYKTGINKDDFPLLPFIENYNMLSYLKKDINNTVAMMSNPIFIRNGEIAFGFFANFCCGGIYGNVKLGFYKNNKWRLEKLDSN